MTLPIPIPGIKDVKDGYFAVRDWLGTRNRQSLFDAWKSAALKDVYKLITDYYAGLDNALFSYA